MTAGYCVFRPGDILEFEYTNHADKTAMRKVVFQGLDYGAAKEYYPTPRWLLRGFDLDKKAARSFDLAKIDATEIEVNGVL